MAKRIIVIQLEASEDSMPSLLDQLRLTVEQIEKANARVEVSVCPPVVDELTQRLADTLVRAGSLIDTVLGERSAFARTVSLNDEITWWSDDDGFLSGRVIEVHDSDDEGRAFRVDGYDHLVAEDDLYRPLTKHDALLWGVAPGDEVEWYCPPEPERRESGSTSYPHGPNLSAATCPGRVWHRGRVERVFHLGFEAPAFQVEGCSEKLREPLLEIRVPPKSG